MSGLLTPLHVHVHLPVDHVPIWSVALFCVSYTAPIRLHAIAYALARVLVTPSIAGRGMVLPKVFRRLKRRHMVSRAPLTSAEAPSVIGYVDVNTTGNFILLPDGTRRAVSYSGSERLTVNVPYTKLEAFYSGASRGWGVRCGVPISQGQVVVEVRLNCMLRCVPMYRASVCNC